MSTSSTPPRRSRGRVAAGLVALVGIGASLLPGLATPALADPAPGRVASNGVVLAPEAYAFTDISGTGTRLALADIDDGAATVNLGFALTSHTASGTTAQTGAQVQMGADGFAVVKTGTRSTRILPVDGDWGLWNGAIYWSSTGEVGSRRFVAQFHQIAPIGARANTATYQVVVDEGSPTLHVAYADNDVDVTPRPVLAVSHTEGADFRSVSLASPAGSGSQFRVDVTPPDATAPTVTAAVTGQAGRDGWHTGAPTVTWTASDAQSPVLDRSGCETSTVPADTTATGVTFSCTAVSGGGVTTESVTLKRDTQAPTVVGTLSPATPDGKDGWYVSAPTLSVDCADAVPGSGLAACGTDGNTIRTRTFGEGAAAQTAAGTAADVAGNSRSTAPASVRVDLADPVITCPAEPTLTYGSDAASLVATVSDGASGATAAHVSRVPSTLVLPGRHTVELTASDVAGRTTTVACGYQVAPAPLTVTASAYTAVYGEPTGALLPGISGLVAGDTVADLGALSCTAAGAHAGTHAVTCTGVSNAHYAVTYVAGSLTVSPAALLVRAPSHSRTYGLNNPPLVPSYEGFVAGETAAHLTTQAVCSTDATASSRTADYAVVCTGATSSNYTITEVRGTLSVTQADVVVTAPSVSRVYGAANPGLEPAVRGLVGEDRLAGLECTTAATSASHVGDYATTCTAAPHADYVVKVVNGLLTVKKAPLTVATQDTGRTYGAADPTFTPVYDGFVAGDTVASLTTPAVCATSATSNSPVATYPITCDGASSSDYEVRHLAGTLTVTPAKLVVAAPDAERPYGGKDPALTATVTGLVAGDTHADLAAIACATTAAVDAPAGIHPTVCTGGESPNYLVERTSGTLTVTPAALVVSGPQAKKAYGDENPVLTADYAGLVAGDVAADLGAVCTTAATAGSPVGPYDVTCSGVLDPNYAVTYAGGVLTVTPASLTVTAPDATRPEWSANPEFTAAYSGLTAGDTVADLATAASCSTPATTASPAGTYAITCEGVTGPNYAVTYVQGTLTVTARPAAPVLTAPTGPVVVDATSPAGTKVSFTVSAAAAGRAVPVGCSRAAGTTFPIGRTAVTCAAPGADPVTFTVHVRSAAEQLLVLAGEVTGKGPGKSLQAQVRAALTARPALTKAVLRGFQAHLKAQSGKSVTAAQAKKWIADADRIMAVIG